MSSIIIKVMEATNSIINLHFIDFDGKPPLYDQIELFREKDEIVPKRLITEATYSKSFYYDYSFSTSIQIRLSNSKNQEIHKEYEIEIFKNSSTEVYLLIKDSFLYQIDLYAQTTSDLLEQEKSLFIKVNDRCIDIPLNLIDKIRFKSIVYFCNVPLITFNCLKDGYQISNESQNIYHLKFCFYFLEEAKKYSLTIHQFDKTDPNETTKKIAEHVISDLDNIEHNIEEMKTKIMKLFDEKFSSTTCAITYHSFFTQLGNYFILLKDTFPLFYDIINLPLKYLPFTEQVLNILNHAYFFSILNETTIETIREQKASQNKETVLFSQIENIDNAYVAYQMIQKLLEKDESSIEIKIKKISVYYTCVYKCKEINEMCDLPTFFDIEKNCKNNIYKKATELFRECIKNIRNDSFLCEPLMLLNSNVSKDLNLKNNHEKNVFEINIINIEDIRKELTQLIPSFIFRWESNTMNRAFFDIKSKCVVINEMHLFGQKKTKMNLFLEIPSKSFMATSVLVEFFHEIMGHGKKRVNNDLILTPEEFIFKGKFEHFKEKEAGIIIEQYLASADQILLMKHSHCSTLSNLQDYALYTAKSNEQLIKSIKKIERNANKYIISDFNAIMKEEAHSQKKSGCVNDPIDYTKTYVYTMKTFDLGYTIDDNDEKTE